MHTHSCSFTAFPLLIIPLHKSETPTQATPTSTPYVSVVLSIVSNKLDITVTITVVIVLQCLLSATNQTSVSYRSVAKYKAYDTSMFKHWTEINISTSNSRQMVEVSKARPQIHTKKSRSFVQMYIPVYR